MAQRPKSEAAPSSNLVTAATRERISRAAVTAFEMYGLSRLRVDDVARLAGVSRPTVYRAFPDRESLILEILVHLALQLNQRIHSTVPLNAPLTEVLEKIMVMTVQTYAESPHHRELLADNGRNEVVIYSRRSERLRNAFRHRWVGYLEAAASRGELRPGLDHDKVISWLIVLNATMAAYLDFFDHDINTLTEYYRTFAVSALLAQPALADGPTA